MKTTGKEEEITINVFSPAELEQWRKHFRCSKNELIDALLNSGKTIAAVKEYLKR
jgi:hypothetical protein